MRRASSITSSMTPGSSTVNWGRATGARSMSISIRFARSSAGSARLTWPAIASPAPHGRRPEGHPTTFASTSG